MGTPPVVVYPPTSAPWPFRRVEINGVLVGRAYSVEDVREFMRRAGIDNPDPEDPTVVEWQGGDSGVWS